MSLVRLGTMRVMVGVALAGAAAVFVVGATAKAAPKSFDRCPPQTSLVDSPYDAGSVITGAFQAIKRVFPEMNYRQGRTPPVTRRTTLIKEVIQLNGPSRDALNFRRIAARWCGAATALLSWAVVAQFPLATASASSLTVFVVHTRSGWRLYGRV